MTRFEILKGITDVGTELLSYILEDRKTYDEIKSILLEEVSEDELRTLKSIAQKGCLPFLEDEQ